MQMQSEERMQKPFLIDGIVTKSSVFYYSLCINAKMQREKIRKDEPDAYML
jgi:hypothetical protein